MRPCLLLVLLLVCDPPARPTALTAPLPRPAHLVRQVVNNDQTSVLIRTLQNKKAKEEAKRKQSKAAGAVAGEGRSCGGLGCMEQLGGHWRHS